MHSGHAVNFQDLIDTIADAERNASYDASHKYVIRSLYSQYDLENMTSTQRAVMRQALAYLVDADAWNRTPGSPSGSHGGQTDYWWAARGDPLGRHTALTNIILNITRRR